MRPQLHLMRTRKPAAMRERDLSGSTNHDSVAAAGLEPRRSPPAPGWVPLSVIAPGEYGGLGRPREAAGASGGHRSTMQGRTSDPRMRKGFAHAVSDHVVTGQP